MNETAAPGGVLPGYAHVSTTSRHPERELDAVKAAGVEARWTYTDRRSGASSRRPGLERRLRTPRVPAWDGSRSRYSRYSRYSPR